MPRDTEKSDPLVYKYGEVVGIFVMSKADAEKYCEEMEQKEPGIKWDWNFAAGRVVMRRLDMKTLRDKYDSLKAIFEPSATN